MEKCLICGKEVKDKSGLAGHYQLAHGIKTIGDRSTSRILERIEKMEKDFFESLNRLEKRILFMEMLWEQYVIMKCGKETWERIKKITDKGLKRDKEEENGKIVIKE